MHSIKNVNLSGFLQILMGSEKDILIQKEIRSLILIWVENSEHDAVYLNFDEVL
jgi:hypothetical protein